MAEYRLQIMESTIKQTSAIPRNQQGLQYSFSSLLKAPYNKGRFFFALYRFFTWIFIQVFRVQEQVGDAQVFAKIPGDHGNENNPTENIPTI